MTSFECMPRLCVTADWMGRVEVAEARDSRGRKAAPASAMLKLGCKEERSGLRKAELNSLAVVEKDVDVEYRVMIEGRAKPGSKGCSSNFVSGPKNLLDSAIDNIQNWRTGLREMV